MLSGHCFRRIRRRPRSHVESSQPVNGTFLTILSRCVIERFASVSSFIAPAILLELPESKEAEDPPMNPGHPACADFAPSDYCRESWQLHLAELRCRPETHWHECDFHRLCAIVPVVYRGRCLAAVKLACPAPVSKRDFERQVELLDLLVRDFVAGEAELLERTWRAEMAAAASGVSASTRTGEEPKERPSHQKVLKALHYIEEHLSDPKLTVGRIAQELDIHPSYLSQLFADQVKERIHRFIAARRVELAKKLLATTDWQIKRIAHETGHANASWFCHIFGDHTGLTPGAYRESLCSGSIVASLEEKDPESGQPSPVNPPK